MSDERDGAPDHGLLHPGMARHRRAGSAAIEARTRPAAARAADDFPGAALA